MRLFAAASNTKVRIGRVRECVLATALFTWASAFRRSASSQVIFIHCSFGQLQRPSACAGTLELVGSNIHGSIRTVRKRITLLARDNRVLIASEKEQCAYRRSEKNALAHPTYLERIQRANA